MAALMGHEAHTVRNFERIQVGLRCQAAADIDLALRVAVLVQIELSQPAIAERLGVPVADVKAAIRRLREVAPALEREERDWDG
jgi:hypothetical protein